MAGKKSYELSLLGCCSVSLIGVHAQRDFNMKPTREE